MTPTRVAAIIGTRPEAIKMAPVLRALNAHGIGCALALTGQHADLDLAGANCGGHDPILLPSDIASIDADTMCDRIEASCTDWLNGVRPELLLVQGDTNSALAAARAGSRCGIPIGHVEAGLRTHDEADPWPEERNRREIDRRSTLLFAPSQIACANLEQETLPGTIFLCGNTGIDALLDVSRQLDAVRQTDPPLILVTVHRRENRGDGMAAIGCALRRIADVEQVDLVVPLHLNASTRAEMIAATLGLPRLRLLEPQSFAATVSLMMRATLILTDSGGLQEEGAALGCPLVILRASTERPEIVASGNAVIAGTDADLIVAHTFAILREDTVRARMSVPAFPYGQGDASALIADAVTRFLVVPNART